MKNLTDQIGLVEETFDCYAHQLQAGTVKVTPSDLARMVALYQQLGDALATLAHRVPTDATMASATVEQQLEHKLGVVRNLLRAGQLDDLLRELDRTGSNGDISDEEDPR